GFPACPWTRDGFEGIFEGAGRTAQPGPPRGRGPRASPGPGTKPYGVRPRRYRGTRKDQQQQFRPHRRNPPNTRWTMAAKGSNKQSADQQFGSDREKALETVLAQIDKNYG